MASCYCTEPYPSESSRWQGSGNRQKYENTQCSSHCHYCCCWRHQRWRGGHHDCELTIIASCLIQTRTMTIVDLQKIAVTRVKWKLNFILRQCWAALRLTGWPCSQDTPSDTALPRCDCAKRKSCCPVPAPEASKAGSACHSAHYILAVFSAVTNQVLIL